MTDQLTLDLYRGHGPSCPEMKLVMHIIRLHRGRGKAIKTSKLCELTGLNVRRVRSIIKVLIEEYGVPVGSTTQQPAGYYLVTSAKEKREVFESLMGRGLSILKRASAFNKSEWMQRIIGQLGVNLEN